MENTANSKKLIVITGPTASGKTDLALKLAKKFNGEIISADSRQVYRGMDIGTGKVKKLHHVIDVASPRRTFTVAEWKTLAEKTIEKLIKQNKIPFVVGGTAFYIEVLIYNLNLPEVKPNKKLRAKLDKVSAEKLFAKLRKLDPDRAATIDSKNKRRLIRALEITDKLGSVPSLPWRGEGLRERSKHHTLILGLKISDERLRKNINKRIDARVSGIIGEIKKLRSQGVIFKRLVSFGLEYKYFSLYLQGKLSKQEATEQLKTASWRFAKRQHTYFKRLPVKWIKTQREAENEIKQHLKFYNK